MPKYKFIEGLFPTIFGSNIIKDPGVGGIKLTYEIIPNERSIFKPLNKPNDKIYFIKLYKKHLGNSKNEVPKGDWGNTSSPLSNVWMESKINFNNFQREYDNINVIFFEQLTKVTDHYLISNLNKLTKLFELPDGQSKSPKKLTIFQKGQISIKLILIKLKQ